MDTSIREKLHRLIDNSSNDKLEQVYQLFQEEEYTHEFKLMLDSEYEDYMQNGDSVSSEEVDKIISQYLSGNK